MKTFVITTLLFVSSFNSFSQTVQDINLLQADSSWSKEIFPFPLRFAPEIDFHGVEEARFPGGWSDPKSDEFWSYVFVWQIRLKKPLNALGLETHLKTYFDGLTRQENTSSLVLTNKDTSINADFVGEVRLSKPFNSDQALTLNVTIEQQFENENQTGILLFRFSPQDREHKIWQKLNAVRYRDDC
ncbi:MAG: hypothetical protein MI810_19935 [Flavobacteriales bacterium]|nr:hypothetical protein [Flavobacteriales bacterium]